MLAAKAQYSLGDAEKYFKEHLCVGDYYTEGQQVLGRWLGKGAENLGLAGVTRSDAFLRLCENLHPHTREQLTLRQNTTRKEIGSDGRERESVNRRVFYDFTFSPPKSVSIAALVGDDARIVAAHEEAVTEALNQLQSFASTRVRKKGQCTDRTTGNIVAAVFRHETSRALDPHLHSHCILFNATFDPVEKQWKALQNHDMLAAQKFIENVYYHALVRELVKFGYQIENKPRGDFEIKGLSPSLIEKFSKRHREINHKTSELLERELEKADGNIAAIRENIAHKERARKIRDIGLSKLQAIWDDQLLTPEKESLRGLTLSQSATANVPVDSAESAVAWAEEHLFERRSVVHEHELWRHALERARGQNVTLTDIQHVTRQRGYLRDERHPGKVTIREHLQCEWEIVQIVKEGVCASRCLVENPCPANPKLDHEQCQALDALLSSTNIVSLFRGAAGTGKSFVLRELVEQVRQCGRDVVVLAPQRQQIVEMEKAGFPSPMTVSSFLQRRELSENALVVVDEAGQIGGRQMLALIERVGQSNARLLLSGDTRQHGPVEASDALLAIERHSGIRPIELHNIRRQDPSLAESEDERRRIKQYRKAVQEAAAGKLIDSFHRLDEIGAVMACRLDEQAEKLADEYVRVVERNASAVVVSQTWAEVHRVNSRIRDGLKAKGLVGAKDSVVQALDKLDLSNAQKRDELFYPPAAVVVFNQKVRDAAPGMKGKLAGIVKAGVLIEVGGKFVTVQNRLLDRITVCRPHDLSISEGDRLQLKANRKLANGARVTNGEVVAVKSVRTDGGIELADGRVLDAGYREFLPGYAVTSYGSQGRTVDYVLFSDSTIKAATNAQQWYVSISRGRRGIRIFTPDKEQLRENITRSGERALAVDMLKPWEQKSLIFRLMAGRFGVRAARVFERSRHARFLRRLRERVAQRIHRTVGPAQRQSRGQHI